MNTGIFQKFKLSHLILLLFIIIIPLINFDHQRYSSKEGIIIWDVKSYYAYLPATFIYNDLSLDFMKKDPEKFKKLIWPVKTPIGKKAILTTMGQAVLYSPFFMLSHLYALSSEKYKADGYSLPYHVGLQFSVFIYFIIAFLVLRKILLRYYSETVTAITLLAVGAGTNLFYYISYSAAMTHGFLFFLIVLFIYYLEKWHDKMSYKTTIILGLVSGLIALVRPTNIIILVLIPLWRTGSWRDLSENLKKLFSNWLHIIFMAIMFITVWVPQFIYWKYISGKLFYFSYGERTDKFFWGNPQIFKLLFSYEKGWFVYTPMMLLAVIGLFLLKRKKIRLSIPISICLIIVVYVLSSWWSWWFGGAFGQRSMIDYYGLMAIPLAAFIDYGSSKKRWKYFFLLLIFGLIAFNQFNIRQYRNHAINYWWMNKEAYWENFLKLRPTCKYWNIAMHPDYEKARLGIYEPIAPFNRSQVVTDEMLVERITSENKNNKELLSLLSSEKPMELNNTERDSLLNEYAKILVNKNRAEHYFKLIKIDYYMSAIEKCKDWKKEIERKANYNNIPFEEMQRLEAERIYKMYSQKYDQR